MTGGPFKYDSKMTGLRRPRLLAVVLPLMDPSVAMTRDGDFSSMTSLNKRVIYFASPVSLLLRRGPLLDTISLLWCLLLFFVKNLTVGLFKASAEVTMVVSLADFFEHVNLPNHKLHHFV